MKGHSYRLHPTTVFTCGTSARSGRRSFTRWNSKERGNCNCCSHFFVFRLTRIIATNEIVRNHFHLLIYWHPKGLDLRLKNVDIRLQSLEENKSNWCDANLTPQVKPTHNKLCKEAGESVTSQPPPPLVCASATFVNIDPTNYFPPINFFPFPSVAECEGKTFERRETKCWNVSIDIWIDLSLRSRFWFHVFHPRVLFRNFPISRTVF